MRSTFPILLLAFCFLPPAALAQTTDDTERLGEENPFDNDAVDLPRFLESSLQADDPVHIADEIIYSVVVEHAPHVEIDFTRPDDTSRWRELSREIEVERGEVLNKTSAQLHYTVLRPGPTEGPPIKAMQLATGIDGVAELELPHHPLVVRPLTSEDATLGAPHPPRPLWTDRPLLVWFGLGGGALLFFALAGLLFTRLRRRAPTSTPNQSPYDAALSELTALRESQLLEQERFKLYYLRLSEILRRYLGRRFDFPAMEWTTTEISTRLRTLDDRDFTVDPEHLIRWLRACDRVKFAGFIPEKDAAQAHLNQALHFVEATRPQEPSDDEVDDNQEAPR